MRCDTALKSLGAERSPNGRVRSMKIIPFQEIMALSFADVLGGESKVRTGAKPRITRDGRTTFVVSALKG